MLRHTLLVAAGLGLAACHVSFGSAPPSSSSSTAKAPTNTAPKKAPVAEERAADSATPTEKAGQAKRTTPKKKAGNKSKPVRTNPKKKSGQNGKQAVRTNPKKKGGKKGKQAVRTNPKKKGGKKGKQAVRTNPQKKGGKKGGKKRVNPVVPADVAAGIHVTCNFEDGWVAVLPADVYDPGEEFLMQALIGLRGDPGFWGGLSQYAKYEPYKAQECKGDSIDFDLDPGKYVVAVGMANQFFVRGEYRDNGYVEEVELAAGAGHEVVLSSDDLAHTWLCISCPFLVVFQDGQEFEVGQVLKDRYTRRRYGTDIVHTKADVRKGVLRIRLDEREPETSFIDAVTVRVSGQLLSVVDDGPKAIRAMDDDATALVLGDSVVVDFDAGHLSDGLVDVEIRVSGHYEAIGPLL